MDKFLKFEITKKMRKEGPLQKKCSSRIQINVEN